MPPYEFTLFEVVTPSAGVVELLPPLSMVCFVLWLVVCGMTAATAPVSTRFYVLAFMILREAELVRGLGLPI